MRKFILMVLMVLMASLASAALIPRTLPTDLEGDPAIYNERWNGGLETSGVQIDFVGFSIATNNSATIELTQMLDWKGIDFIVESVSSGSITTANIINYQSDWSTILSQETLTSGTPVRPKTNYIGIVINNPVSTNITVTMSVLVYDNDSGAIDPVSISGTVEVNVANEPTVNLGEDAPEYLYHSKTTLYTSSDTEWQSHALATASVEININTAQNAYIGYDTTANFQEIPNTLDWQNKKLPAEVEILYWKHITVTGDMYIEELERQ